MNEMAKNVKNEVMAIPSQKAEQVGNVHRQANIFSYLEEHKRTGKQITTKQFVTETAQKMGCSTATINVEIRNLRANAELYNLSINFADYGVTSQRGKRSGLQPNFAELFANKLNALKQ